MTYSRFLHILHCNIYTTVKLNIINLYVRNEVLRCNEWFYPSNRKMYAKEPHYNETSLKQTNVGSPLALRYIEGSSAVN